MSIEIPGIQIITVPVKIVGDSPLICNRWSDKAKRQMLDKQMKKGKLAKEAKDPEADFLGSLYVLPNNAGYGFPAIGVKAAAVSACRFLDDLKMTGARGAFHINGELLPIDGTPQMREDMVRVGMTTDIRYRGEFMPWSISFDVRLNPRVLSYEQLLSLFHHAGFGVGIGEWRPERDGSYGMFHVE